MGKSANDTSAYKATYIIYPYIHTYIYSYLHNNWISRNMIQVSYIQYIKYINTVKHTLAASAASLSMRALNASSAFEAVCTKPITPKPLFTTPSMNEAGLKNWEGFFFESGFGFTFKEKKDRRLSNLTLL